MFRKAVRQIVFLGLILLACVGTASLLDWHFEPGFDLSAVRIASGDKTAQPGLFSMEPFYAGNDSSLKEFGNARSDHAAIALAIAQCDPQNVDPARWSDATRAALLFELDQNSMHTLHPRVRATPGESAGPLKLTDYQIAVVSFSDRLSRDRLAFRRELEDNQDRARRYQVAILLFGVLSTIAIGFRSMLTEKDSRGLVIVVGIAAILCSAVGTAVSTMSNYDNGQAISIRDKRALTQLQQLHWRVASDVLSGPDRCGKEYTVSEQARATAWRERLEAILDSAVENLSRPGDLAVPKPTPDAIAAPQVVARASPTR